MHPNEENLNKSDNMKLVISSSELLKGIMTVAKAIPSKSALPILENFLFVLKGNTLEITASDSELTMKTSIEVENAEEEGQIAILQNTLWTCSRNFPTSLFPSRR